MSQLSAPVVDVNREVMVAERALRPALARLKKVAKIDLGKIKLGALADHLYDLRAAKAALNGITVAFDEVLPVAIKNLEEHFISTLAVGESSGVQGMKSRVQISDNPIPTVEDWAKFYAHIKKTGNFELLNRAVNRAAVKERWEEKKQVPGVGVFHDKRVSVTKLNGKGGK